MLRKEDHFELLDIRTPAEIERGVLPNAKTLPMHMVPLKLSYFSESLKQIEWVGYYVKGTESEFSELSW